MRLVASVNMATRWTESPWFWLALWGSVGLFGAWAISPKFAVRQARLERMHETRTRVRIEQSGGEVPQRLEPDTIPTRGEGVEQRVRSFYLLGAVAAVGAVAWGAARWNAQRRTERVSLTEADPTSNLPAG